MIRSAKWSLVLFSGAFALLVSQGCVATRNWVKEQMDPLEGRVSENETRLSQTDARVGRAEGRLSAVEGQLGQVDAKAERALGQLANLRLERRFVLDLKEGANFAFNSAALPEDARQEIDGFLSDLKGDLGGLEGVLFLVAGHTDATGSDDYNYALGRKRAEGVARYLIIHKKLDPLRVVPVSYGKSAPLADNSTREGRAKNRRVEILVYQEGITSTAAGSHRRGEGVSSQRN